MNRLEELLRGFSLSDDSRKHILEGDNNAPKEFEPIAKAALAGHFCVKSKGHDIVVRPTCVEFYYHEEADNGIKGTILSITATAKKQPNSFSILGFSIIMYQALTSLSRKVRFQAQPFVHRCLFVNLRLMERMMTVLQCYMKQSINSHRSSMVSL